MGLDYDPIMIEMARSLAPEIEWRQGDLQNLPFPDALYDLVICQQGLQYLPDCGAGLRQIHRVLRPGALAKSPGHVLLFQALEATIGPDREARPVAKWSCLRMKFNFWSLFRRQEFCLGNDHDHIVANEIPIGAGVCRDSSQRQFESNARRAGADSGRPKSSFYQ